MEPFWADISKQRRVSLLTLFLILWSLILQGQAGFFTKTGYQSRYESPVLAVELARSTGELRQIVGWTQHAPEKVRRNVQVLRINTALDFGFIFFYWSWFIGIAALYRKQSTVPALYRPQSAVDSRALAVASRALEIVASSAALLDVIENLGILQHLGLLQNSTGDFPTLSLITHHASVGKWACSFVALVIAGALLFGHTVRGTRTGLARAAGAALVAAGAAGCDLMVDSLSHPEVAPWMLRPTMLLTALGVILTAILFAMAKEMPNEPLPGKEHEECKEAREHKEDETCREKGPSPPEQESYPGGGGDDAVCFTSGPEGAYFGAGVIHAYLAARRKHPVVTAGISTGALNAAALQKCYQELTTPAAGAAVSTAGAAQTAAVASKASAPGAGCIEDAPAWSWFRRYVQSLTDRPLAAVWEALPDMSDFFADMPPVQDKSLPQPDETAARRQRYILIKLGRRLAALPLALRSITETITYYVRHKEGYGRFSGIRFHIRRLYLFLGLISFLSVPVADNFYRLPRRDGKEPSVWRTRPLFGLWAWWFATLLSVLVYAVAAWGVALLLLLIVRHHAFVGYRTELALATPVATILLWLVVWVAGVRVLTPENPLRDKVNTVARLVPVWVFLWIVSAHLLVLVDLPGSTEGAAPISLPRLEAWQGTLEMMQKFGLPALAAAVVLLGIAPVLVVGYWSERKKNPEASFRYWISRLGLEQLGLSKSIITDFYIMQRLKRLFDPCAERHGGYSVKLSNAPMPLLLVSAPLQTIPAPGTIRMGSQQVWPSAGAYLVEALRASIAMPGFFQPVTVTEKKELKLWLDMAALGGREVTRLDLVDGAVIRHNPLPALFAYLNRHETLAKKLERPDGTASIHVVFSVPLEPRKKQQDGKQPHSPSNIVDVALLSQKLARRRDTKLEVQQSNYLSKIERLIRQCGGKPAPDTGKSAAKGRSLNILPIESDCIAPEDDISIGPMLAPDRIECLKVIAAGCRQSLQRLYGELIPHGRQKMSCRDLLALVWRRNNAGKDIAVPDPAGLPEVCGACCQTLHKPAGEAEQQQIDLSPSDFPQLTGTQPRVVFVASGGVFRGAFQVGVMASLLKADVGIDLSVGASVGTLMGGALAAAASSTERKTKQKVISDLVSTFLQVDEKVALTVPLKSAVRELAVRGRSILLSPHDVQRMIRRGSRFDAGYAVSGAPPALLDAIATLFVLPYVDTKKLAGNFVAGHVTAALTELLSHLKKETLSRLGIEEYLMGVSLLERTVEQFLLPATLDVDCGCSQPYLKNGRGVALFGTTTNLLTWQVKVLGDPQEFGGRYNLIEAALSSSAFPAVFQPRRETDVYPGWGDPNVLYSDGGMFDNLPFIPAIEVLTSVQRNFLAQSQAGASKGQRIEQAYESLECRHRAPDLFIVGSLDAGPDHDKGSTTTFDSILAVHKRARRLNANLKITDFEFASVRLHHQVERLLKAGMQSESAGALNAIIDGAVLPIFPNDSQHLNPTFAFCRALGLDRKRIQRTISHGCFQTFAAIAKAQAYRPKVDEAEQYDPHEWKARSTEELLSKSVWGLFRVGKMPLITKRTTEGAKAKGECPFFEMTVQWDDPLSVGPLTCPFAEETENLEVAKVFATCCADRLHKASIAELPVGKPPAAIVGEVRARTRPA